MTGPPLRGSGSETAPPERGWAVSFMLGFTAHRTLCRALIVLSPYYYLA